MHALSIARIAHDADRSLCALHGDMTTPGWFQLDDVHRENARVGVAIAVSMPDATPEQLHGVWLKDRKADGWRFGPQYDGLGKRDPLIRPWSRLTRLTQLREQLFVAVVRALSATEKDIAR